MFDGIELPSVPRIFAQHTKAGHAVPPSGIQKSQSPEIDGGEHMWIENGNDNSAPGSFHILSGSHNNGAKTPTGGTATKGRRIAEQNKKSTSIPPSDLRNMSSLSLARREGESSSSRGTYLLAYCTVG